MAGRRRKPTSQLVALFLDMLAAERGAGAIRSTPIAATSTTLPDISGRAARARRATTDDLRGYLAALSDSGFKASSVARRLSAIRQLYRFLYAESHRTDDPAAVLEGPKRGRALPKVLSIAEVDRLLAAARARRWTTRKRKPAQRLRAARLLACSKLLTRPACASPNWWRCRDRGASAIRRCWWCAAKAARNGWCRSTTRPSARWRDYLKLRDGNERDSEMAVSVIRRERPPHASAFCARAENARRRMRHRRREDQPACAAPRLRQSPAAQRRRPARGADAARPLPTFPPRRSTPTCSKNG